MSTLQFDPSTGIFEAIPPPVHRGDEYDEQGFATLLAMQREHFWYQGRHRLILSVLRQELRHQPTTSHGLHAIDLGGGCGGWLEFLHAHNDGAFERFALADSSMQALSLASAVVHPFAARYHVDLLDLPWQDTWNTVFLLDVLEHIPDDLEALRQAAKATRPGGLLFVTAPALRCFWTYNDELSHHQRRYSRHDFEELAHKAELRLLRTHYFMFFLSPVLLLSRRLVSPRRLRTMDQQRQHLLRTHRIPARPINALLGSLFSIESLLVNRVRFPWGTSILGVFRREQ